MAASLVGTTIEWYDFFVFGSAAALVFNTLFFPKFDPLVGTILAFATYAVGFVARPLGGIVFGHFGDRVGRKGMLVLSLLIMGVATFAIGLLPTYASIGVWAPILLVICRLLQGFAVGGEWGGAVLMVAEHGDPARRGFWASWPQAGVPAGNLLAVGVLAIMAATTSDAAFASWGWRVPFLLSAALVAIGLYVRVSLSESPVFQRAQAEMERAQERRRAPMLEVVQRYRRAVLVAMGARVVENVSYYIFTVFVLTYVTTELGMRRATALNAVLIASAVHFAAIPLWGALSDRVGRRPIYLLGAGGVLVWAFLFFALVDTRSFTAITAAITGGLIFHAAMYGPQAAFFSELFGTGVRYSGASIGYQLASVFAGSLAPIIAVALLAEFNSALPISIYVAAMAVITIAALIASRETVRADLADEPGFPPAAAVPTRATVDETA
ncbi:MFS transporter [Micromonospora rhizosphaerae]|uniref:MFS transporter n=1 Tax=Micromonospora rhizosphaerae TaxID=568872 RepID=UPI001FDF0CD2|nr:MFS transporter [Micromonospora rhizosphaerae]